MNIGQRIKQRREQLGYTQEELAEKLGYASRSSVNKVENSREVSIKKIELYANALETTVPCLMGWENREEEKSAAKIDLEISSLPYHLKEYLLKVGNMSKENQEFVMKMIDKLSE